MGASTVTNVDTPALNCIPPVGHGEGLPFGISGSQCRDPNAYGNVVTYPFGVGRQPITGATVVDEPSGITKTYYSTDDGKVVRVVNNTSGARVDMNYDEKRRLKGWRSAFGDRACVLTMTTA